MEPSALNRHTRVSCYRLPIVVLDRLCHVEATLAETADHASGEETTQISIDSIVDIFGQTIFPSMMNTDQFSLLCQQIKQHHIIQ